MSRLCVGLLRDMAEGMLCRSPVCMRSVECHLLRPGSASLPRELLVAVAGTVPSNWLTVQRRMCVKGLQMVAVALCVAVWKSSPSAVTIAVPLGCAGHVPS